MTTCYSQQFGVYDNDEPLPGDIVIADRPSINHEYINGAWVLNKTTFNNSIFAQISKIEDSQSRAIREAAIGIAGATDRLTALNNQIVALRKTLVV